MTVPGPTPTPTAAQDTAEQRLEDQLCLDLYVAARTMINAYRTYLAPYQLTHPQYLVMLALWQHGPQSVSRLGARLVLDAGTLSPLLKRLEATGYVRRERQPDDARELRVSLTPAGLALRETLSDVSQRVICATGLSLADKQALQLTLRGLTAQLKHSGMGSGAGLDPEEERDRQADGRAQDG